MIFMLFFGSPVVPVSALGRRLFAVGRVSLLSGPCVSVAGSRRGVAPASIEWLQDMLAQVHNHSIVSGLALGVDRSAHETALELGLPTIAVLPSGFFRIAPRQHVGLARRIVASGGLLVSEYEPQTPAKPAQYVARNRIIAELGKCLLVPQCEVHSGTMHTVRFAHELHRPLFTRRAGFSGNSYIVDSLGGHYR